MSWNAVCADGVVGGRKQGGYMGDEDVGCVDQEEKRPEYERIQRHSDVQLGIQEG